MELTLALVIGLGVAAGIVGFVTVAGWALDRVDEAVRHLRGQA